MDESYGSVAEVEGMGSSEGGTPPMTQDAGSAVEQKSGAYVQGYLDQADQLIREGRIGEAKEKVLAALALNDKNPAAQERLAEINSMLGTGDTPKDLAQDVITHRKAMRQRQIAEVNDRFVKAQQHVDRGELADAKKELDLADLIVRYDAHQTNFGTLKTDVAALLNEVSRRLDVEVDGIEREQYEAAYRRLREEEDRERRRQTERVRAMMIEAIEAFERQDFDQSEHIASNVLEVAPTFGKAKDLVEMSRQARHRTWREAYYKRRREQVQSWKEQVRDTQIPWHDVIQFPTRSFWDRITTARRGSDSTSASLEESESTRALNNKLKSETVDWNFTDMTLQEAIQYIRDTQNINILPSKTTLEEKGEETVDYTVRNLNFDSALREMLRPMALTYRVKNGIVHVVGQLEATGDATPKVYEVRDLTIQLPNFRPPNLTIRPGPAGESSMIAVFGDEDEPTRDTEPEQLLELVRENVARGSWDIDGRALDLSSGQLVAVTTPEIHREISQFLEDLRRFTKVIVHVETRFIAIREGFLSEVGLDIRGLGGANPGNIARLDDVNNGNDDNASAGLDNGGSGLPASGSQSPTSGAFFQDNNDLDFRARTEGVFNRALGDVLSNTGGATIGFTFLDDLELGVLFTAVEKSLYANVLTAPRLTIYNNQRANLTLVNQVSYVKDYDVEVAQTAFIADPLIDIVQDGLVLDVHPTVSHDRRYVTLELRPTVAILTRPIQTFVTPLAGLTTNVIIELPEIEYRAAATTVRVPDNGHVVIGGLKNVSTVDRRSETPILADIPLLNFFFSRKGRSDEISDLVIVVHVRIIDLDDEESRLTR